MEATLARAQKLFADVARFLESEIDRQFDAEIDAADEARIKTVKNLIHLNQQALLKVIEIEARLGQDLAAAHGAQALDLEAARVEIERRLARLAA